MKELTLKQEMKITDILEHPRNKELFTDIKDSNPSFWLEFKDSIKRFGIIEPLLVNKKTKYIRSGNQRFMAAVELGLETVPVILIDDDTEEDELAQMIASNVYRRQIDPFKLFEYVAELRKGHQSSKVRKDIIGAASDDNGLSLEDTTKTVHKDKSFVSASDIWATLTEEQKAEIKERFKGEMNMSEGKLIAELRKLESEKIEAMEEYKRAKAAAADSEERERAQAELVEKLQSQIDELKLRDVEEELAERDAQIRALEKQKAALKKKLQEPDLNKILEDCIKEQRNVSIKLADLFKHKDGLDGEKLQELGELMAATMATIRNGGKSVLQIGG